MTAPAEDARPSMLRRLRSRERGRTRTHRAARAGALLRKEQRAISALITLGAGVVFILLGWYGAAHTNILTEQIPYLISGGLLGLGLIIVAGIMASSAAIERDNRALREDIAGALAAMGRNVRVATPGSSARVYLVPGGRAYHVEGCPILEGKDGIEETARADAEGSGLAACKLCGPD